MLVADDLAAFRAERLVFAGIGFSLAPGQSLLLSGANGSGKSTLLRLLAGLLRPAAGALAWRGANALADLVEHAARIAYLGHQEAIKPALSVAANLAYRAPRPDRLAALGAMGLEDLADLPARLLSAGQRRRLALARLVLRQAPLWLLDEPTLGLDQASIARLGTIARRHLDQGGMIIAATHVPLPLPGAALLALDAHPHAAPGG